MYYNSIKPESELSVAIGDEDEERGLAQRTRCLIFLSAVLHCVCITKKKIQKRHRGRGPRGEII